jgi:hypothetical protein
MASCWFIAFVNRRFIGDDIGRVLTYHALTRILVEDESFFAITLRRS